MKLEGTAKELARMCRERDATIKKKDDVIVSQAREIVALEEKIKEGRDVILTGLKIIEEMLELGID